MLETKSPELTTFYGQRQTSVIWDAVPDINRMHVYTTELYHRNNPPISNYEPGLPFNFKYLLNDEQTQIRPLLAGTGIAIDYIAVDSDNGYIQISNTFTNAAAGGSGTPIYNQNSNTFKTLQGGSNLSVVDTGASLILSLFGVPTSQSLSNTLGGYINSIDTSTTTDGEFIYLINA